MTVSALTRPGERDRLIVKIGEIDWIFCLTLCLIAGAGALMLFSIAGSSWWPWAAPHLIRFALFFAIMIVLSLIDLYRSGSCFRPSSRTTARLSRC